jgi:hypothetical protein
MKNLACFALVLAACGSDTVSSTDNARKAYLGLDGAVDRAINLGLKGKNEAQSANIPTETGSGDVSGTLTVTGMVDQGTAKMAQMTLQTAFVMYQDRVPAGDAPGAASGLTYDSDAAAPPALGMSLKDLPNGTLTGTFNGKVHMSGGLKGDITLALSLTATLQPVPTMTANLQRVPGSTHITGTATSDYGTYMVDITR